MTLEMVLLALIERDAIDLREVPNPQFYLNDIFPNESSGYRDFCKKSLHLGKELKSFYRETLMLHVLVDRPSRIFASCLTEPKAFGNIWKPGDVFVLKGKF